MEISAAINKSLMKDLTSRKNPRLAGYDYSSCGAYFVTICTHDRRKYLSQICRDDPCGRPHTHLSTLGRIAQETLKSIEEQFDIIVDSYAIMPDHIHLILFLPQLPSSKRPPQVGRIIGAYKSRVSNQWLKVCKLRGIVMGRLWQDRYYDHIIRNDIDLAEIRSYIDTNPDRWIMKHTNE